MKLCNTPVMRRPTVWICALTLALTLGACQSGGPEQAAPPDVDFTPKIVVIVDGSGVRTEDRQQGDGLSFRSGTVIEVRNTSDVDRRVRAKNGTTFYDTGIMQPGDSTVVVLSTPGVTTFDQVPVPGADRDADAGGGSGGDALDITVTLV